MPRHPFAPYRESRPSSSDSQIGAWFFFNLREDTLIGNHLMIQEDSKARRRGLSGFRISRQPVVPLGVETRDMFARLADVDVPRSPGGPTFFAVGRDPRTIFACWCIDWPALFAGKTPADKRVYLRVYRDTEDVEEKRVSVEPLAGSCFITVSNSKSRYRLDIGYFEPGDFWNSVATPSIVVMPVDRVSESFIADLATLPLHLSFQRLLNLHGGSAENLAEIISGFQRRAVAQGAPLTAGEREIFKAINLPLSAIARDWRTASEIDKERIAQRDAALLGFVFISSSQRWERDWPSGGL
jgi:hypothetical protein